jgi:hypothetical protein
MIEHLKGINPGLLLFNKVDICKVIVIFQEMGCEGDDVIFVCECGKLVSDDTFKVYISTSVNPSTRTIGHSNRGLIFNFVDGKWPKKYSSKKELKIIAITFAENNKLYSEKIGRFLLEVDRLKSCGKFSDDQILVYAYQKVLSS